MQTSNFDAGKPLVDETDAHTGEAGPSGTSSFWLGPTELNALNEASGDLDGIG